MSDTYKGSPFPGQSTTDAPSALPGVREPAEPTPLMLQEVNAGAAMLDRVRDEAAQRAAKASEELAALWKIVRETERMAYNSANSLDVQQLDAMNANLSLENAELRAALSTAHATPERTPMLERANEHLRDALREGKATAERYQQALGPKIDALALAWAKIGDGDEEARGDMAAACGEIINAWYAIAASRMSASSLPAPLPAPTIEAPMTFPRRNQMQKWIPAERAIHDAVQAVELVGAHPLLTDAVILLGQAQRKVADYVDLAERAPDYGPSSRKCRVCGQRVQVDAPHEHEEEALPAPEAT